MKKILMTFAVVCAFAAAARAQEQAIDSFATPTAPPPTAPPESAVKQPGLVCTNGVCAEPAPKKPAAGNGVGYEAGSGLTYKSATDNVTVYGLLDITLSTANNADDKGRRKIGYQTSWFSGDRWGVNGRHLFGGSDKFGVAFRLESEYVLNTGEMDTPNVLFNRDAWVGFESETLGQVHFGRQNTLARDFSQNYGDPYRTANITMDEGGWTNTNNFKQLIFYAGSASGTRYDNGVVWKKNFGDRLVAGLGYQFGQVTGDFMKGSTSSAALAYNGGIFNVSGFYTHANVNGLDNDSYSFGGNVKITSFVRLNAGYFHYSAEQGALGQRTDHAFTVSTKIMPGGLFDFEIGYQVLRALNAGYSASGNTITPFNDATGAKAVGDGDKKTLYGSIFYRFDRRAEVYLAGDYMNLSGGYKVAVTHGAASQTELAVGLRFRF